MVTRRRGQFDLKPRNFQIFSSNVGQFKLKKQLMQLTLAFLFYSALCAGVPVHAYSFATRTVIQGEQRLAIPQGSFVKIYPAGSLALAQGDILQVARTANEVVLRAGEDSGVVVRGMAQIGIYTGVDQWELPTIGRSVSYRHEGKIKLVCQEGFAGQFCLEPVIDAEKLDQIQADSDIRKVLFFNQRIKLKSQNEDITLSLCFDQFLSKCQQIRPKTLLEEYPFYLVIGPSKNLPYNLQTQNAKIQWSQTQVRPTRLLVKVFLATLIQLLPSREILLSVLACILLVLGGRKCLSKTAALPVHAPSCKVEPTQCQLSLN